MPSWPSTLPASPLADNFFERAPDTSLRTEMEQGPAKLRRRTTAAVRLLSLRYLMNKPQIAALETFYAATLLGGTLAFDFTHPRSALTVSCRFLHPPEYISGNGNYFTVAVELEVLP